MSAESRPAASGGTARVSVGNGDKTIVPHREKPSRELLARLMEQIPGATERGGGLQFLDETTGRWCRKRQTREIVG